MIEAVDQWRPSGRCSMFTCDVASFGHASRTDEVQERVREGLYKALSDSFGKAGVPLEETYQEDRGDGAMILVPDSHDPAVLVTQVLEQLRAALKRYNRLSVEPARIQLRVAVHVGIATSDANGILGTELIHVFRLLDAAPFKEMLRRSGATLALIVSDRFHDEVVRRDKGMIDPDEYRKLGISVKETETFGWVRIPGQTIAIPEPAVVQTPAADPNPAPFSLSRLEALFEVVDLILEIPPMTTERGREQIVGALGSDIATVIPRSTDARSDVYQIIRTCLDYPGGLQRLLTSLRLFVGDSLAMNHLEQTLSRVLRHL